LEPFFDVAESRNCGVFVLVKTSNPGGGLFQDLQTDGKQVFEHVAEFVEQQSALRIGDCGYGGVGAVIGATYPQQLSQLRKTMSRTWFLIPGFGAQGGSAKDVAGAFDPHGLGAIINSSRGIIFAHRREPYQDSFGDDQWQDAVQAATKSMIAELAEQTPSSALQVK
jgi:orotidine-5'-phosphate decarboxylase